MYSHTSRTICFVVAIAALVAALPASPRQNARQSLEFTTDTQKIRVVTLADGLDSPWSMAFLPNGDILFTERPGRLRIIRGGKLQEQPIAGGPKAQFGTHGGLLDVTLHPNFAQNNWIYLAYSKAGERGVTTAVARGRWDGKQLVDTADVFVADAWTMGSLNVGG